MAYKKLIKVSNVCQVLDKSKYHKTLTINGVTFTNNGDGTITVNGTATNDAYYTIIFLRDTLYLSHKYLLTGENPGLYLFVENRDKDNKLLLQLRHNIIRSLPTNTKKSTFECYIEAGRVCDNLIFKPQLFDLTEMYGAGNEPTTVEQFRQDFPEEMYDYSPYCFVKSYKKLIKVSNVCQLLDKNKFNPSQTINGITFTNNGDGTITVNGTATSRALYGMYASRYFPSTLIGHKCLIKSNVPSLDANIMTIHSSRWEVSDAKPIGELVATSNIYISVFQGYTVNNIVFKPQLFDLTEMYGAGNEPTTVAQFRQDFPEEMYDYKPYSIITSHKRNLTCKTKNLFDINSYSNLNNNSNITINGNSILCVARAANAHVLYKIPTVIGEKYTVSNKSVVKGGFVNTGNFCLFLSDNPNLDSSNYLVYGLQSGQSFTLTATSEFLYIHWYVCYAFDSNNPSTLEINELQVNLGDTAADYVPYGYL